MSNGKVLAIGAHPDDVEIGCGGTLTKLISQGYSAEILVATSGESGRQDISREDLAAMRKEEAKEGSKILGADKIHFFDMADGLTSFSRDDKVRVIDLIREVRPQILFVHAKQDLFPDHQVIHNMVMSSINVAAGPWYQESQRPPHTVEAIYGYEVWNPLNQWQLVVDITSFLPTKLEALRCHKTQTEIVDYGQAVEGLAQYRGALTMKGKYAETFEVLKTSTIVD